MNQLSALVWRSWAPPAVASWLPSAPRAARPADANQAADTRQSPGRGASAQGPRPRGDDYRQHTPDGVRWRRAVAYGLWVVASLAGTAALTALPVALSMGLVPASGWMMQSALVAVAGGGLLLLTVGVAMGLMVLLERTARRPDAHVLAQALRQGPDGAVPPNGPTSAPATAWAGAGAAAVVALRAPVASDVASGVHAIGLEGKQRDMRGFPPCAAFAPSGASKHTAAPNYVYQVLAPDGMSYNVVGSRAEGWRSHLLVGTLMDGLSILTYDAYGKLGQTPWLAGSYVGMWPREFAMVGGEAGGWLGQLGRFSFGARFNGNVNFRHMGAKAAVKNPVGQSDDAFVNAARSAGIPLEGPLGTLGAGGATPSSRGSRSGASSPSEYIDVRRYEVARTSGQVRGRAGTPAASLPFGPMPVRGFLRMDRRYLYDEEVLSIVDADTAINQVRGAAAAPGGWGPGALRKFFPYFNPKRLWSWYAQGPEAAHGTEPLRLTEGGRLQQSGELLRGRMPILALFGAYVGRYDVHQHQFRLRVAAEGEAGSVHHFRVTYIEREQKSSRRLMALAGGSGTDAGQRALAEVRLELKWPLASGDKAQEAQHAAVVELSDALRGEQRPAVRQAAWGRFVQQTGCAVSRTVATGTGGSVDAGTYGLPACASYLPLTLPQGFGEGLSTGHRARSQSDSVTYPPGAAGAAQGATKEESTPLQVAACHVGIPHQATRGPFGRRSQTVWSELAHTKGAGAAAAQLSLRLCGQWKMSRATPLEALDYVAEPLWQSLQPAQPDATHEDAATAAGVLAGAGWQQSVLRTWATSRDVEIIRTLTSDELEQLALLGREDWAKVCWPEGADANAGLALSQAVGTSLPQLRQQTPDAESAAWRALQRAVGDFVDATALAGPGLLHVALNEAAVAAHRRATVQGHGHATAQPAGRAAPLWLSTRSDAYDGPQQTLDKLCFDEHRLAQLTAGERAALKARAAEARLDAQAAALLAESDPFLLPAERPRYRQRLLHLANELQTKTAVFA